MQTDPKIQFGRRLRAVRKLRGWSQEKLALEVGLDRTYISGIESGKRNVSLVNICRLAQTLDVPVAVLFEWEEAQNTES